MKIHHIKSLIAGRYRRGDIVWIDGHAFRVTDTPTLFDAFCRRLYWWERLARWFAGLRRALQ